MQILMSVLWVLTTVQRKLTASILNTVIIANAKRDTVVNAKRDTVMMMMDANASKSVK